MRRNYFFWIFLIGALCLKACPVLYAEEPGQNVEKLLSTLNETLEENRKIRQNMRDLQSAFEKITLERNELITQMRRFETAALKRDTEATGEIEGLSESLEKSRQELEALKTRNENLEKEGESLSAELQELSTRAEKYEAMLETAVLDSERDAIHGMVSTNEAAVESTLARVSEVQAENLKLREELIMSHFNLGNTHYGMGEYEKAKDEYEKVLAWHPANAWAHHNLALVYDYHLNRSDLARKHYEAYLNFKPVEEEAREIRLRVWDLKHQSQLKPDSPLSKDFQNLHKNSF